MKKLLFLLSLVLFTASMATEVAAQAAPKPRKSPLAVSQLKSGKTYIRILYSQPHKNEREVFGGLVPFLGTLIVEFTKTADNPAGDPLAGLWYPIGVASICLFIGVIYLTNRVDKEVMD